MSLESIAKDLEYEDRLTVTKGDMKIEGSPNAIATLLVSIDKIHEDNERKVITERTREQKIRILPEEQVTFYKGVGEAMVSAKGTPRSAYQRLYRKKRAELDKRKVQYPNPREVADAYINNFGKKYNRENIIFYTKSYLRGKRLLNNYRRRVLMCVYDLVNDISPRKRMDKIKTKRQYIKRDWDALAREYLARNDNPSITAFLASKGIHGSHTKMKQALDNIKDIIYGTKKPVPVFSTSATSSVG